MCLYLKPHLRIRTFCIKKIAKLGKNNKCQFFAVEILLINTYITKQLFTELNINVN